MTASIVDWYRLAPQDRATVNAAIDHGEKEASSELLASICAALNLPMSKMLSHASDRVAESEAVSAPVTLPIGKRSETMVRASTA